MTAQHPALLELDKHVIVFVPGFLSSITADGGCGTKVCRTCARTSAMLHTLLRSSVGMGSPSLTLPWVS